MPLELQPDAHGGIPYERLSGCRLCGSGRVCLSEFLSHVPDLERPQDTYSLLTCSECGLGSTDPFPSRETLARLYSGGDSSDYEFPAPGFLGRLKDRLAARRVRTVARKARIVPSSVLDFGTGAGRYAAAVLAAFPTAAVTGTDFGAEPPPGSYFDAHPRLRYRAYDDLIVSGASFDLILARHVLEHVHDPVAMLRQWLSLLQPGGVVYVEVPNFASRVARLVGARWPLWYVPKHLSHFDRRSLRRAIEEGGGRADIGTCEMPLMGNILALLTGHSRFDPRFRLPGIVLHPVQVAIEALGREGSCLYALIRH